MKTNIDLFENIKDLPQEVREIIFQFENSKLSYEDCKILVHELEIHGYTCEYGLDFQPYNLQKLETTNETPEEMNTDKNILKGLIEDNQSKKVYIDYMVRCDNKNKPEDTKPDKTFNLYEIEKLNNYLQKLNGCNYDLVLHEYDEENEVVTELYIVSNNYKNK